MEVYALFGIAAVVVIGLLAIRFSMQVGKIQDHKDSDVNKMTTKHKIGLNPILWAYILVVLAVIVGAYIFYTMVFAS